MLHLAIDEGDPSSKSYRLSDDESGLRGIDAGLMIIKLQVLSLLYRCYPEIGGFRPQSIQCRMRPFNGSLVWAEDHALTDFEGAFLMACIHKR
jgi:hypothetical protein